MRRGLLTGVFIIAVLAYCFYGLGMYLAQDLLIFPVMPVSQQELDRTVRVGNLSVHHPVTPDGTRLLLLHARGDSDRLLIYFHGNGGGITATPWFAAALPGWDVISFSYRGYPGSEGQPSESGMIEDAQTVWRYATQELGFSPDQIVVHGQSMGGGVVNHLLAGGASPAAAVFDSTFLSVIRLARRTAPGLPLSLLLRHPFRSEDRASEIDLPVLVIHGDSDTLIPVAHGRALAKLYPNAVYQEVPRGGHNQWLLDDPMTFAIWHGFVTGHVPAPKAEDL